MRTSQGQAEALSGWWGQDPGVPYSNSSLAPLATPPRPITWDGRAAWQTSVLITRGFDVTQCDGHQIVLWESTDQVRTARPGELHELQIGEVGQNVIVIDSTSTPGLSADDLRQLNETTASIRVR